MNCLISSLEVTSKAPSPLLHLRNTLEFIPSKYLTAFTLLYFDARYKGDQPNISFILTFLLYLKTRFINLMFPLLAAQWMRVYFLSSNEKASQGSRARSSFTYSMSSSVIARVNSSLDLGS